MKAKRTFLIIGLILIGCEVIKQLILTYTVNSGAYQWWYFPFQLCSVPMYVSLIAGLTEGRVHDACAAFLSTFCLLSGIMAFCDTSGFQYPLPVLTVYSYLWHMALIATGIYAMRYRVKTGMFKPGKFAGALLIYLVGAAAAEAVNVLVYDNLYENINMFYISPRFVMAQVCFRDLVPVLGNNGAILLYILFTMFGAFLAELAGRIFRRREKKDSGSVRRQKGQPHPEPV